ncbi:hypothetical protein HAX54_051878, partial [Datura stramonium]|nr:hypothetical protein [Datura stramonium]
MKNDRNNVFFEKKERGRVLKSLATIVNLTEMCRICFGRCPSPPSSISGRVLKFLATTVNLTKICRICFGRCPSPPSSISGR